MSAQDNIAKKIHAYDKAHFAAKRKERKTK